MIEKIKRYLKINAKKISNIEDSQNELNRKIKESIAITRLSSILVGSSYLPVTNSSMNFTSLAVISNDIIINQRKTILEFGSGISTILIARLFRENNIKDGSLISVEHDERWLALMDKIIRAEGVEKFVHLIHAPLTKCRLALDNNKWYDLDILQDYFIKNALKVDSIIVDGPPAWQKDIYRSRYPAYPFIKNFMNDNSVIFLDDTNRDGEKDILIRWQSKDLRRVDFDDNFTGLFNGRNFNIKLF